jgi:hypothetical protein
MSCMDERFVVELDPNARQVAASNAVDNKRLAVTVVQLSGITAQNPPMQL